MKNPDECANIHEVREEIDIIESRSDRCFEQEISICHRSSKVQNE